MSKYTLSQKQKDAYKAVINAMKITPSKYDKKKIGENSYTGFEMTVFNAKSYYNSTSAYTFESKNANFNKKWKRSWNSIPTIKEIREAARKEYDDKINPIQKRVIVKKDSILKEKEALMVKYSKVFFKELDKAKKSSKQTKNVKDLLAVQSIFEKKVLSFIDNIYSDARDEWEINHVKDIKEDAIKKIQKLFDNQTSTLSMSFHNINQEDLGYRKDVLDMRGSAEQAYHRSFQWCADKKERAELREKALNEDITNNKWYRKYLSVQNKFKSLVLNNDFISLKSLYTTTVEADIYEPQRGDNIHTLNMLTNKHGEVSISWDDASNDCWSYIPKGYYLETSIKLDFNFMYSSNKTKSLITDDRKVKTLYKDLEKLNKEISKIKEKKALV